MKNLLFLIAEKIATDNNPNTIFICAGILKDAFIQQGVEPKIANEMAIDGIKIVTNTMFKMVQK